MALSASAASAGRGSRAEKVRRIFERFDANGDGGLDRNEMAALVVAVNPRVKFSEDQISAILDEVFRTYAEFILPDGRGLSLPGLLRTYDDGAGDVDRDFLALSLPAVESDASSPEIAAGDAAAHSSPPPAPCRRRRVLPDDHAKLLGAQSGPTTTCATGEEMDGLEGCVSQDCKDAKKVDSYSTSPDGRSSRNADCSTGRKSVISSTATLAQPGGTIWVGSIGCSAFGLQKCKFSST